MLIALVPTPHDPALTARTFIQNPRLTAALERIKAQKTQSPAPPAVPELSAQTVRCPVCGKWAGQSGNRFYHIAVRDLQTGVIDASRSLCCEAPASVISGIETDGSDAGDPTHDDERPTERELNEIYLLVNGWQPRGAQCTYWYDPLSDVVYPFAYAMGIQDARDYVDSLAVEGDR